MRWAQKRGEAGNIPVDVVPGVKVAADSLAVESVALNSFKLASNALICAAQDWVASPVTEATQAAEATDAASSLNTAGGMYVDIRDWDETCKKYAGRVEVTLTLLYNTVVCDVDSPELSNSKTVVGCIVPCHVSQDVGIVAVGCVAVCEMPSQ
ncbi:hypothetical protein LA080_000708 [Diaporthe eres]|nr:hypothetical protein LA080_000708 [Diaporthe eres]